MVAFVATILITFVHKIISRYIGDSIKIDFIYYSAAMLLLLPLRLYYINRVYLHIKRYGIPAA